MPTQVYCTWCFCWLSMASYWWHIVPIEPTNTNYQPQNKNDGTGTCDSCHENTAEGWQRKYQQEEPLFKAESGESHQIWISLQVGGGVSNEKSQQVHQLQRRKGGGVFCLRMYWFPQCGLKYIISFRLSNWCLTFSSQISHSACPKLAPSFDWWCPCLLGQKDKSRKRRSLTSRTSETLPSFRHFLVSARFAGRKQIWGQIWWLRGENAESGEEFGLLAGFVI